MPAVDELSEAFQVNRKDICKTVSVIPKLISQDQTNADTSEQAKNLVQFLLVIYKILS